ncbi:MAG: bifunctional 3,4-dihydroxy-2-butanone-4-phosphate synthase/GTP cyclohydrolase II [Candidatus Sericytochromatia bacterium]|uniref:Riboflavin biosynthesis protein RibBA n=1 Tax=Candidatus Tanganyikabacteria bacterium TaxID=2961651 RepID=A0A937X8C9_9BACT|nr:bifunctional 3,4-dihydroxy-2-butanone-4-phosphate synthase/GTP cyclohydrolase II [Candidatus Tanganyikabacteria bacterium]
MSPLKELADIPEVLEAFRAGKVVVVVDDEDRENEGDLIVAAEHATPEVVNFMATHGRGLICLSLTLERGKALGLDPMVPGNGDQDGTAFTVSIDALVGATTGISAPDRARTIQVCLDPATRPSDLRRPGHIFPLIARPGGVLTRAGHTEAAVDLARLSGLQPAGVICEVLKPDGEMARLPDLLEFAKTHGLLITSVAKLIAFRLASERFVVRRHSAKLPTQWCEFTIIGFENTLNGAEHVALVLGDPSREGVLVRMHSECLTGDAFGSMRCDCGQQRDRSLQAIAEYGNGVFVYLRGARAGEGRGIGLVNKIHAYNLQDQGLDTVEANQKLGFPADLRDYGQGAQILVDLGVTRMRLLTNNPRKVVALEGYGLEVEDRVPLKVDRNTFNARYLQTKVEKLGHILS